MDASSSRGGVLLTGLNILEALAAHKSLGVTQLASLINADKGNVHRVVRILCDADFVEQDASSKHYSLTGRVVQLAGRAAQNLDIREHSQDVLQRLALDLGESAHLAVRTVTGGVYVAQVRSDNRLTVETEIGSSPPIHCTATGKALYSDVSMQELATLISEPLPRHTPRTRTTIEEVFRDIAAVRTDGYATDDEELNRDIRCAAAPIYNARGAVVAAIGVSGPVNRVTLERLSEIGAAVQRAAGVVTERLGGVVPA